VWELGTGCELRTLRGHSGYVTAVAVTAGGRLAISVSEDKTLRAWELGSGGELAAFTADAPLKCCAISVDGKTIVAGDESGVVHYLRLELAQSNRIPQLTTSLVTALMARPMEAPSFRERMGAVRSTVGPRMFNVR